ncbi:MAG: hypothetical protein ACFFC7_13835 [Candidatus Hermodarchaeota archaeon]
MAICVIIFSTTRYDSSIHFRFYTGTTSYIQNTWQIDTIYVDVWREGFLFNTDQNLEGWYDGQTTTEYVYEGYFQTKEDTGNSAAQCRTAQSFSTEYDCVYIRFRSLDDDSFSLRLFDNSWTVIGSIISFSDTDWHIVKISLTNYSGNGLLFRFFNLDEDSRIQVDWIQFA